MKPTQRNELRWGVLSTAAIGRKVVPAMQRASRSRVVAVGSRDLARARDYARELAIANVHPSYEAVLADPEVDAVYIPLPNHLHREWTIAAVEAGKHVLCHKPLAMNAAEAQVMVDTADAAGVVLMEAFMYRLHPSWSAVFDMVRTGRIGRLISIQSWFGYYNDDTADIRNIREFGGGALYDIGCYCINLSRLLFDGEPRRVQASVRRDPASGVDVLTSAILDFEGGIATFTCTTRSQTDQRVHIYGSHGRISVGIAFNIPTDRTTELHLTTGGSTHGQPASAAHTEVLSFGPHDQYTAQAEEFAAVVLDGAPPRFPASDAVANMRVIDTVFGAAEAD